MRVRAKKYRIYADCLMNTKIMVHKPKPHYNMELDIENAFHKKEYFKSLMMCSNMVEAFLRRYYVLSFRVKNGGKLLTDDVDAINRIPLSHIIDWSNCKKIKIKGKYVLPFPKRKIVNDKQYKKLIVLKEVRNDIAHSYYLNYDENINHLYAEKIIKSILPILSSLIKKYVSFRDKQPKATSEDKMAIST